MASLPGSSSSTSDENSIACFHKLADNLLSNATMQGNVCTGQYTWDSRLYNVLLSYKSKEFLLLVLIFDKLMDVEKSPGASWKQCYEYMHYYETLLKLDLSVDSGLHRLYCFNQSLVYAFRQSCHIQMDTLTNQCLQNIIEAGIRQFNIGVQELQNPKNTD